jgi:hypothetical protein
MLRMNGMRGVVSAGLIALALGACDDLLTVSDPQRYTASDLDNALPAVANGVEGALHEVMDTYVVYQSLLSDVYQHTGTWSGYDETDHSRFQYGTSQMDVTHNSWLRAQWFAVSAEDRITRVLEGAAANDPMMAQVHMSAGLTDLYIGMAVCESPIVASGPAVTDQQVLQSAVEKLTRAMATAQAAGTPEYGYAAQAGRARAKLLLGDYAGAAADAAAIPDGFSYDAVFNQQSSNWVVTVTTATYNEAAGLMHKWWDQVAHTDGAGYMLDPWTGEEDTRIPVYFENEVATDNETPHYSQWKYQTEPDDIPMVHSDAMRLIQAEAAWRSGDEAGARTILNNLRAAAGLSPLPAGGSMQDYILSERFAEMFMEGMRMVDLYRFGIVAETFNDLSDPLRPGAGRITKFSMTDTEATYNALIDDDLAQRCLPTS